MPDTAWWVSERLRSAWRRGLFEGLPEVVSFVFPPGRPSGKPVFFRQTRRCRGRAGGEGGGSGAAARGRGGWGPGGARAQPRKRAPRGPNDGSPYTACCVQVRARLPAACGAGEGDGRRGRSVGPDGDLTRRTPPTPSQAAPPITHTPPAQSRADGSRTVPASISIRRSEQALAGLVGRRSSHHAEPTPRTSCKQVC